MIKQGTRVRVFRNLTRKCYSVQHYVKGKGWRMLGHVDSISLKDVEFKVYKSGRERTVREGKKYVHAYVIGTVTPLGYYDIPHRSPHKVTYNPHKHKQFIAEVMNLSGRTMEIYRAQGVDLVPEGVFAL